MRKELDQRVAQLSSEKKRLLEQRLKGKAVGRKREAKAPVTTPEAPQPAPGQTHHRESAPLSYGQQRLWFLDQMEESTATFHVVLAMRLRGPLDAAALDRALCRLLRRQSSLRTTFAEIKGEPKQHLQPAPHTLLIPERHATATGAREQVIQKKLATIYAEPFDLVKGPLFRPHLIIFDNADAALFIDMHHIITDGWSVSILSRELDLFYRATLGHSVVLPTDLPCRYLDYANNQRSEQSKATYQPQLDAIRARLQGAPAQINLPYDYPRPPKLGNQGAVHHLVIDSDTVHALRALCLAEKCSLYVGLFTAFATLLQRLGGDRDIVIGTPAANRESREHENLIGFFVNTLAMRVEIDTRIGFRNLIQHTRSRIADGFANATCPFDWVVEAMQCKRQLNRTPLFQVMFTYQEDLFSKLHLGDLKCSIIGIPFATAMFDLSLNIEAQGDELICGFEYNTELFKAGTVAAIAQIFKVLLTSLTDQATQPIESLPIIDPQQQTALIRKAKATSSAAFVSPLQIIAEQAQHAPWNAAIRTPQGNLSYAQLHQDIAQLAARLVAQGVGAEDFVGICMTPSPATITALLAILQAGGAWLSLDPNYPGERLALMVSDAQPTLILADAIGCQRLRDAGVDATRLVDVQQQQTESATPLTSPVVRHPDQAAYAIFTSGTTGRPKAAVLPQRALAAFCQSAVQTYGFTSTDRILQFASFSFDAVVEEIFPCLMCGATLIMSDRDVPVSPTGFLAYCASQAITVLDLPTGFWRELVCALKAGEAELPACVRLVIIGGEHVHSRDVAAWFAYGSDQQKRGDGPLPRLVNSYGPTETCVVVTTATLDATHAESPVPIGRPMTHVGAILLDSHGKLVPPGLRGRLFLSGPALARGYLASPAQTAAVFVPNPYGEPGSRMYNSGDLAFWLADQHRLGFSGRHDQQVKIRGFRVEPGEIEHLLNTIAEVEQAVIQVKQGDAAGPQLIAYLQLHQSSQLQQVKDRATSQLPSYMLPGSWVTLKAFPKTITGKIDTRALAQMQPTQTGVPVQTRAARSPLEKQLCQLFSQVLDRQQISPDDDFFEIGGHSLLAVRLIARIRQTMGQEVGLRTFFAAPTPAKLAAMLENADQNQQVADRGPTPVSQRGPLSFAQQQLWVLDRLGAADAYHVCEAYTITATLNFAALDAALLQIMQHHEVLRTVFHEVDGQPVAKVTSETPSVLTRQKCNAADLNQRLQQLIETPFNLSSGPLLRVVVIELEANSKVPARQLLLWVMHHIIADAASTAIFLEALTQCYQAQCAGQPAPLPPLPIQYGDYAVWQRASFTKAALKPALRYWRDQLHQLPKHLNLPDKAHANKQPQSYAEQVSFTLDADLTSAIEALAHSRGSTPFLFLYTTFVVLLHHYTRSRDITLATPVSMRSHPDLESLIGFFVNTLVLRLELSPHASFNDLLTKAKDVFASAHEHKDLPFEHVVEALNPDRQNFIEVLFAYEGETTASFSLPGLTLEPYELKQKKSKFPLSLVMAKRTSQRNAQLVGAFQYDKARFHASTITSMAHTFRQLLHALITRTHAPIHTLINSLEDSHPDQSHATKHAQTPDLMPLFHKAVEQHAQATAVQAGTQRLTSAQLYQHVQQLAAELRARGVGPEVTVGVCMPRSCEMLVAVWGILAAGGVYVPLDPDYPEQRLQYMAEDAGLTLLLTTADNQPPTGLAHLPRCHVSLHTACEQLATATPPTAQVSPHQAAYMIYTSGSTGKPKGVVIDRAAASAYVTAVLQRIPLLPSDRVLQFSSPCFDGSIMDLLAVPLTGATLVLRHPRAASSMDCFLEQCRADQLTLIHLPTAFWREWVWALKQRKQVPPASVRSIIVGGESMQAADRDAWLALAPHLPECINAYGPTETIGFCTTANDSDMATLLPGEAPPIGRPNPAVSLTVKHYQQTVPLGVTGELFIGGPTVARGYHGLPALTAAHFLPDPNAAEPGSRCYRSGDMVCLGGDHEHTPLLWYRGRADSQVKIRGYRIELGEVTTALNAIDGVRHAVVFCLNRATLGNQLAAALVLTPGSNLTEVRRALAQQLPAYMLPEHMRSFSELPQTPVGKIDMQTLEANIRDAQPQPDFETEPPTPFENALAEVWCDVLGIDRVGVNASFFELGGHSLAAIRLAAKIRSRFNLNCDVRDLFDQPTVRRLAELLQKRQSPTSNTHHQATPALMQQAAGELSLQQKRLWFLDRHSSAGAAYHVAMVWRIQGALQADILDRAFCKLLARQSALRARFPLVNNEPRQDIGPLPASFLARRMLPESELTQTCQKELAQPFDLETGPLMRGVLFQHAPAQFALLLVAHHLVTDGWSLGVIQREINCFYRDLDAQLPALPVDYLTYSSQQAALLRSGHLDQQREYWRKQLADLAPLNLPHDKPRPSTPSFDGARFDFDLGDTRHSALQQLARRQSTSLFSLLYAAFALLLSKYANSHDIAVGVPYAGRDRHELQHLVGFFVNTLVLRLDLSGDPSFIDLLTRSRDLILQSFAHADLPFDSVVEAVAPPRDPAISPLFQVMFSFQGEQAEAIDLGDLTLTPLDLGSDTAQFDLTLTLFEGQRAGLLASFEYSTDLFTKPTIATMAHHFTLLLDALLAKPETRLSGLTLIDSQTPNQLMGNSKLTQQPQKHAQCLHELVFKAAAQHPDKIAVMHGEQQLTYRAFLAQAQHIAGALQQQAVGPDSRVGVYLSREIERVPAILGILAAGGAFVPLDEENPEERLAFQVRDAGLEVVLGRNLPAHLATQIENLAIPVIDPLTCDPSAYQPPPLFAEHLAYVIYTSGSTGQPKGTEIPHAAVVNYVLGARHRFATQPGDRLLRFTAIGFDVSVEDIFVTLASGATLVERTSKDLEIEPFLSHVREQQISILSLPTSYWRELSNALMLNHWQIPASVRLIVIGGEALPAADLQHWHRHVGQRVQLINAYGPTETTISVTMADVAGPTCRDSEQITQRKQIPIGEAFAEANLYVVDATDTLQPVSIPGELLIGGLGLARGYLGNPGLTAERFVPNPFAQTPGERLYRSGDLVRRLPQQGPQDTQVQYVFISRVDRQFKLRGFRIEPGEIETALQSLPGVAHALILVRGDQTESASLEAHWVRTAGADEVDSGELLTALRERLPAYMVPSTIYEWPIFPMLNGKVDRNAVASKSLREIQAPDQQTVLPRNMLEFQLLEIWESLLPQRPLGVTDNFFDAGGHSLLAVRLMTRIRQKWAKQWSLDRFFRVPTIAGCAELLLKDESAQPFSHLVPIKPNGQKEPLFCIHPDGGQVLCYAAVARALRSPRPIFGIQALGPEYGTPIDSIETMAERYWSTMQMQQPQGPIHLAGWSFGGVVAQQIACLAESQGRAVAFLGLLDSEAPDAAAQQSDEVTLLTRLMGIDDKKSQTHLRTLTPSQRLDWVIARGRALALFPSDFDSERLQRLLDTVQTHAQAWQSFRPSVFQGSIHFFKAANPDANDRSFRPQNPEQAWQPLANKGVNLHCVPGSHKSMLQPPLVEQLAASLDQYL